MKAYKNGAISGAKGFPISTLLNPLNDGSTVLRFAIDDTSKITKDSSGNVSILWNKMYDSTLGDELNSGSTEYLNTYKITATQDNWFYNGCTVGDIFMCNSIVALSSINRVKKYSGVHLGQLPTLPLNRPIYTENGIFFSGDIIYPQYLKTPTFQLVQPVNIYIVLKMLTWINLDKIFDGYGVLSIMLIQTPSTPKIKAYAGIPSGEVDLPVGTWAIVKLIANGTNSKLQIEGTTAVTGDFGVNPMNGLTLGSNGSGGQAANMLVKDIVVRDTAPTAPTEANITKQLLDKWLSPVRTMTIIGDSISVSYLIQRWALHIPSHIYNTKNHAVGGQSIMNNMDAQVTASASDNADIIILFLGTNDVGAATSEQIKTKVETNIDALKISNPNAVLHYVNVLPRWTDNTGAVEVDASAIRTGISSACLSKNITCWDTYTDPWIIASDTADGIHTTIEGGKKLWNKIKSLI